MNEGGEEGLQHLYEALDGPRGVAFAAVVHEGVSRFREDDRLLDMISAPDG